MTDDGTAELAAEFLNDSRGLYAVLDPACEPAVLNLLADSKCQHQTLYGGKMAERLKDFGPILVDLKQDPSLLKKLIEEGWGKAWGIYLHSTAGFENVRDSLRRLLGVEMPDGGRALFRFYDPRVFRAFLPTCQPEERELFFGKLISSYWVEYPGEETLLRFRSDGSITAFAPLPTILPSLV